MRSLTCPIARFWVQTRAKASRACKSSSNLNALFIPVILRDLSENCNSPTAQQFGYAKRLRLTDAGHRPSTLSSSMSSSNFEFQAKLWMLTVTRMDEELILHLC